MVNVIFAQSYNFLTTYQELNTKNKRLKSKISPIATTVPTLDEPLCEAVSPLRPLWSLRSSPPPTAALHHGSAPTPLPHHQKGRTHMSESCLMYHVAVSGDYLPASAFARSRYLSTLKRKLLE